MIDGMYHYFPYAFLATMSLMVLVLEVADFVKNARGKHKPRQ